MKKVLMVAEKPSLAQAIARVLSNGNFSQRKNISCSIYEWNGIFYNINVTFKMTSVFGHVMTMDFDDNYQNWHKTDPAELFSCPIRKKQTNPKARLPFILEKEASDCDFLILWLDCDKEGENICFEVMNSVRKSIKGDVFNNCVTFRARFSSLNHDDIIYAFQNLKHPNLNESRSVDARLEFDLRIGCAFTRFQTRYFQSEFAYLKDSLVSFGPCQIPTLGFCVKRYDEIVNFVPKQYWFIKMSILDNTHKEVFITWKKGKSFEKNVVADVYQQLCSEQYARVISVRKSKETSFRPIPLNTVELLRLSSSKLGFSPHETMQIAEGLYMKGFISYPRTETTNYSPNFNFKEILKNLSKCPEYGDIANFFLQQGFNKPRRGKDVGDHAPISICALATRNQLQNNQWRLYELILKHFYAIISNDCLYFKSVVDFQVANEIFTISGNEIIDHGYLKILPGGIQNQIISDFHEGTNYRIHRCEMKDDYTSPPDYLSETDLISLMESHGIGTDASIPVHIQNINIRNYVQVLKNRRLKPTDLGIKLIHGYNKIDPELVLPTMRSFVEQKFNLIATGEVEFSSVLNTTLNWYKAKFDYFVTHIIEMKKVFFERHQTADSAPLIMKTEFNKSINEGNIRADSNLVIGDGQTSMHPKNEKSIAEAAAEKRLSRCGKCKRFMILYQGAESILTCLTCNESYKMPMFGNIKVYKEIKCPIDEFEILSWHESNGKRNFIFCPHCYNKKPFPDMEDASPCFQCIHPTCPQSLTVNKIANCKLCKDGGILFINQLSQPYTEIRCNKCHFTLKSHQIFKKFALMKTKCITCGSNNVSIDFNDSNIVVGGCMLCYTDIKKLFEISYVSNDSFTPNQVNAKRANHFGKRGSFHVTHKRGKSISRGCFTQ